MPCAGKTTLLSQLKDINVVNGSQKLKELSNGSFSSLNEDEKNKIRVKYTEYINSLSDEIILSDGHYAFVDEVAFTKADSETYDVFIYLYTEPDILLSRYKNSDKNMKFAELSLPKIEKWQQSEIEGLRKECHDTNKDFYVIRSCDITPDLLMKFIKKIYSGYSSYCIAKNVVEEIKRIYPDPCEINITDGDKTIINQDSLVSCCNYSTHIFDGSFYTGYQSLMFEEEVGTLSLDFNRLSDITANRIVADKFIDKNYVILSSGVTEIWNNIAKTHGLKNVFASPFISADTKFFVVKLLQECGYRILAYGDSRNDLYMLKKADIGYLCLGERLSRSLVNTDVSGVKFIYDKSMKVLEHNNSESVLNDIRICKSSSGICGSKLAGAHLRLGQEMGKVLKSFYPEKNSAVLVLERGGRFFGDGLYSEFGGTLYPYNPKIGSLDIDSNHHTVIIVDSVINTGKSIIEIINALRKVNKSYEFIIVSNVIQSNAIQRLQKYKLFTARISENYFVGRRQETQTGKCGPDTADRLFNLIN